MDVQSVSDLTLKSGTLVSDKYRILKTLGHELGGIAFKARQEDSNGQGRLVTLKFLTSPPPRRHLAQNEEPLRALADAHRGILGMLDTGKHESFPYAVREYAAGATLREILFNPGLVLTEGLALGWAVDMLETLQFIHGHFFKGSDGQPIALGNLSSNAFVVEAGTGRPVLVDPCLSNVHWKKAQETTSHFQPFDLLYLAPEQLVSEKTTPQSDLYALALIVSELLLGTRESLIERVDGEELFVLAAEGQTVQRARFDRLRPELAGILLKALKPIWYERFEDAGTMALALKRYISKFHGHIDVPGLARDVLNLHRQYSTDAAEDVHMETFRDPPTTLPVNPSVPEESDDFGSLPPTSPPRTALQSVPTPVPGLSFDLDDHGFSQIPSQERELTQIFSSRAPGLQVSRWKIPFKALALSALACLGLGAYFLQNDFSMDLGEASNYLQKRNKPTFEESQQFISADENGGSLPRGMGRLNVVAVPAAELTIRAFNIIKQQAPLRDTVLPAGEWKLEASSTSCTMTRSIHISEYKETNIRIDLRNCH